MASSLEIGVAFMSTPYQVLDQEVRSYKWYLFPKQVEQVKSEVEQKPCKKWDEKWIKEREDGNQDKEVNSVEEA